MKKILSLLLAITMLIPNIAYATEQESNEVEPYTDWSTEMPVRDPSGTDRHKEFISMKKSGSIMADMAGEDSNGREEFSTIITEGNDYILYSLLYFRIYPKKTFWDKFKPEPYCVFPQREETIGGMTYILTDRNNKVDRGFILKRKSDANLIERIQKEIEEVGGNSIEIDLTGIKQRRNYKQNWRFTGKEGISHLQPLTNYFTPIKSIKSEIDKGKKVEIELNKVESELKNEMYYTRLGESPKVRNLLVVGYIDKFDSVIAIDTAELEKSNELIILQIRFKGNQEVIVPDLNNELYKARIVYGY